MEIICTTRLNVKVVSNYLNISGHRTTTMRTKLSYMFKFHAVCNSVNGKRKTIRPIVY